MLIKLCRQKDSISSFDSANYLPAIVTANRAANRTRRIKVFENIFEQQKFKFEFK